MKAISDLALASSVSSACALGCLAFNDFLNPPQDGVTGITVVMDDVIRQWDPAFLDLLDRMKDGNMDCNAAEFLLTWHYPNLMEIKRELFNDTAMFIMPT
jgi:hypothetical protein